MIIAMERLKSSAGQKWLESRGHRLVHISSDNGYWGNNGSGYTCYKESSGVYRLDAAFKRTSHCGPEKRVRFHFVKIDELTGICGEFVSLLRHCKMFIIDRKGYCGSEVKEILHLKSCFERFGF